MSNLVFLISGIIFTAIGCAFLGMAADSHGQIPPLACLLVNIFALSAGYLFKLGYESIWGQK